MKLIKVSKENEKKKTTTNQFENFGMEEIT